MVRDRDGICGEQFRRRVAGVGIEEVLAAPRSPWQNPYAERLVGSVRRECLDHVIVLGECHLRRILKSYFAYYHRSPTHLSLDKDAPEPRPIHPPSMGKVVALPEVGGLHHRYERLAACAGHDTPNSRHQRRGPWCAGPPQVVERDAALVCDLVPREGDHGVTHPSRPD
jgi:hypothetical protein